MKLWEKPGSADLHVHTTCSDGMFSPEEVVSRAAKLHLRAISITDHDSVGGIQASIEAAKGTDLEIVPGVEISAAKDDYEIHLLGYFMDINNSEFVSALEGIRLNRVNRMKMMVELLGKEGIDIDLDKVLEKGEVGSVGRLHLARTMAEVGAVRNIKEAFDRYIGDGKCCHVKHMRMDYTRVIDLIRKAGGVSVLAHPGSSDREENIKEYVKAGLGGIEAFHSRHNNKENDKYVLMAKENGLIITGGSDCHGMAPGRILLGKVRVSYKVVEELKAESERIRSENKSR